MIAKNTRIYTSCIACLNHDGARKVVDTFVEDGNLIVLSRCQNCGGITKHVYGLMRSEYISGPRKAVYTEQGGLKS